MEYIILPRNNREITEKDIQILYPQWNKRINRRRIFWGSITQVDLELATLHMHIEVIPEKEMWTPLAKILKLDSWTEEISQVASFVEFAIIIRLNSDNLEQIQPLISFWNGLYFIHTN